KEKKNISIGTNINYKSFKEFSSFCAAVKSASPKTIGLGSVTNNAERERGVSLSAPYLQNVAVLITEGKVPTIKNKTPNETSKGFANLKAIVVEKSSHSQYIGQLKGQLIPDLKIETAESQNRVLDKIANEKTYF